MNNEPDWEAMAKELMRSARAVRFAENEAIHASKKVQLAQRALAAAISRVQSLMEKKS